MEKAEHEMEFLMRQEFEVLMFTDNSTVRLDPVRTRTLKRATLSIQRRLKRKFPKLSIVIVKESAVYAEIEFSGVRVVLKDRAAYDALAMQARDLLTSP